MTSVRQREARGRTARTGQTERRNHYYTEGNVVRKARPSEEYVRVGTEQERKRYHVRKNWKKASFMTLPYVFALTLASIALVAVSTRYLEARNGINDSARTVRMLENQLESLRESNSGLRKSISTYMDLDYIYKTATEEMGMVPAKEDQVIYFDRTESEYVRQNEDIPKE